VTGNQTRANGSLPGSPVAGSRLRSGLPEKVLLTVGLGPQVLRRGVHLRS
jgi:hypothetical protein